MRYSKQREMILWTLKDNPVHPTADYIYGLLKRKMPGLSLGTVYRNLNLLAEGGHIKRIRGLDEKDRFDHNNFDHCHVKCKSCGGVSDIMITPQLSANIARLKLAAGADISVCEILLHGKCADCKRREKWNSKEQKPKRI